MATLEVLNPVATSEADQKQVKTFEPAERRRSLDDLTVGLIWNSKRGGELALDCAGKLLQGRYKNVRVVRYDGSMPCDKALLERAKSECDVFVGSTGD
jgi:hypothetical protein